MKKTDKKEMSEFPNAYVTKTVVGWMHAFVHNRKATSVINPVESKERS